MRSLIAPFSASDGAAASMASESYSSARAMRIARVSDAPMPGPVTIVRVARDGAQVEDVARFERKRVESDRCGQRRRLRVEPCRADGAGAERERFAFAGADDVLECAARKADVVARIRGQRDTSNGRAEHAVVRRGDERDDRRVVDDRLDGDDSLVGAVAQAKRRRTAGSRRWRRSSDPDRRAKSVASIDRNDAIPSPRPRSVSRLPTSARMSLARRSSTAIVRCTPAA